ncbi:MAG TPA: hypothetical protein VNT26_14860 [Candidatus Sulfotelmatobacter sp.]|nr:hypothetical protein [Candidatus Sulfotelmatobacter sp.]HWI59269.1 hypothetical protein [Bacillota bacterium]
MSAECGTSGARAGAGLPSPTLVCFAVKEEGRFFSPWITSRPDLQLLITGMGHRNAEQALRRFLVQARPKLVLSCGFAGGLNPNLASGTVLFFAENQTGLEPALQAAGAQPGRFHCAERVATTAQEKQVLWQNTGADAVEMESQVICTRCREAGIPSATVRVILDTAQEDLPLDFNALMTEDQQLDSRKLALAIMKSPAKIVGLLRLQKQTQAAAKSLAQVLAQALGGPNSAVE